MRDWESKRRNRDNTCCPTNPDLIINTGSAGALAPDRQIGDIVIGEATMYHDADARAFAYELGQVPTMPARYKAPEKLNSRFLRCLS